MTGPESIAQFPNPAEALARLPAMAVGPRAALILSGDGELEDLDLRAAAQHLVDTPHLLCNQPLAARRAGLRSLTGYDVLELFAFVRPARFALPTPRGLAHSLALADAGGGLAGDAALIRAAAERLLADLAAQTYRYGAGAAPLAMAMARAGWPWGPLALGALGTEAAEASGGVAVWAALPEWEDGPPPPPPDDRPLDPTTVDERLTGLLGDNAEARPAQRAYAKAAAHAFQPRSARDAPNVQLAEAGTGTGKTLGYIAPASVWAQANGGPVWLSTFTKNLQRQIDAELVKLYPERTTRMRKAVVRKGRENYACLLNVEEAARASFSGAATPRDAVLLGLVLRWLRFTRDGDMIGGDFPSWLGTYFPRNRLGALTDHRGECLYSACTHYKRCFIEKVARRARRAELVVANHALVMTAFANRRGDAELPRRLVFDEGHHVFDAADNAFAAHLSGAEGAELRRWLRGREGQSRGRARGLMSRLEDLIGDDAEAWPLLEESLSAARCLPGTRWLARIAAQGLHGPFERFLSAARGQVFARAAGERGPHSLECAAGPPVDGLIDAAKALAEKLDGLARPLAALSARLATILDEDSDSLDSATRGRLDTTARSLTLRCELLRAWLGMLGDIGRATPEPFVDWFEVERIDGREFDVALKRHWVDPTRPFAEAVLRGAHGALVTSATLLDKATADAEGDWRAAEIRTGARHLVLPAKRFSAPSPFDYAANARIFIVTDVRKGDLIQLAAAYRALFEAAGGGALGLFTAIARLRAVHARLAPDLDAAGLPLYAQHVDPIDTGTLVDIFRSDEAACLLGTDAVRDGVDVPGRSLRLIVFDRVPWPRPTLLHKARRGAFGGAAYDDMLTRLKLSQAFGRLVRRADDRGVFVLLDNQTPSRLLSAFPSDATIQRVGLAEAVAETRAFQAGGLAAAE